MDPVPRQPTGKPKQLGKYELIARIGVGGMAEVHLARQRGPMNFEKVVVVKTIHPHLAKQQEFIHMLLDEARISALLKHPRVVDIYDLGFEDDTYFIAMEYIPGQTLSKLMLAGRKRKRLDVYSTARIVADAADGLHAAHNLTTIQGDRLELVHRDVSPGNIIVGYDGNVKLVDFGVSKAEGRLTITEVSQIKGKMGYVSPEQVKDDSVDRRSDVFSLGVVLWETLALTRLFYAQSHAGQMQKVVNGAIPTPSAVRREVPRALDDICMRALQRDVATRYQSAAEMRRDLEEFLSEASYYRDAGAIGDYMTDMFAAKRSEEEALLRQVSHATGQIEVELRNGAFDTDSDRSDGARARQTLPPTAPAAPPSTRIARVDGRRDTMHGLGGIARAAPTDAQPAAGDDADDLVSDSAFGDEVTLEEVEPKPRSDSGRAVPLPLTAAESERHVIRGPTVGARTDDVEDFEDFELVETGGSGPSIEGANPAYPVASAAAGFDADQMARDYEGLAREPGPGAPRRRWLWASIIVLAIAGAAVAIAGTGGDEATPNRALASAPVPSDAAPAVIIPDAAPPVSPPDAASAPVAPAVDSAPQVKRQPRSPAATLASRRKRARALYDNGFRRYMKGDLAGATAKFRSAIKLDARLPDAHRGLGLVYERQGNQSAAIKSFKRYLKLRPRARDAAAIKQRVKKLGG